MADLAEGAIVGALAAELDLSTSKRIGYAQRAIDALATRYGQRFRSSSVGNYLYITLGVWLSGMIGLLFPRWSAFSIATQLVINAGVLIESAFRSRGRWQKRWLDYRVVAEQLRWLPIRSSLGIGEGNQSMARHRTVGGWSNFVDKIFHWRSSKVHIPGSRCLIGRGDDPRTVGAKGSGPDCGFGTAIRGRTSIIVTHELSFARDVADKIIFMDGGKVVEEGTPAEVLDNPKTERTRSFLRRIE
jgi:hypothetical protein